MNGHFFRRMAGQMIMQLPHFLCCKRAQGENQIHRMGSLPPLDRLQHLWI
jgi:hypothetical protein